MPLNLFIAGFIGALAPEVLRLYGLKQGEVSFQTWYFLISAIYAVLGGYVATIAPGVTEPWWAFVIGVGLPTVINTAFKAAEVFVTRGRPPTGADEGGREALPTPSGRMMPARREGDFWDYVKAL